MKKVMMIFTIVSLSIGLVACVEDSEETTYETVDQSGMQIFPKHPTGGIGDVMPYFDGERWQIFFLHDTRPNPGFHPWYRISTTNFYEFEDHGEVIPVVHDFQSPELALGTGSVIEKDGLYYAFYTSHNSRVNPVESIMIAISDDNMETWVKQPDLTFNALNTIFDANNFRDPHVVYIPEADEYWMLITTRAFGRGVIGYYASTDLLEWENRGIFFDNQSSVGTTQSSSNLECPTLLYFNGYWYLTFSDQWPDRVTHYRVSESPYGPWTKPALDTLDGAGLYAGKIESDGNRMLLMGWVSTDFNRPNEFAWGGQLIVHELVQGPQGLLSVKMVSELEEKINTEQPLKMERSNVDYKNRSFSFDRKDYEYIVFDQLEGINRITGTIDLGLSDGLFGIYFDVEGHSSSFNYTFNMNTNRIGFYDVNFNQTGTTNPKTVNKAFLFSNNTVNFTILFEEGSTIEGSIVTLYIDGQLALTGRMFNRYDVNFGFFGLDSDISVRNLRLYK